MPARNRELLCVVEEPDSLIALEESGGYRGVYHVLHGALSPLDGIGPEQLRIGELLDRIAAHPVEEVIVATNPSVAGETTALLLSKLLKERGRQGYAHRPRRSRGRATSSIRTG